MVSWQWILSAFVYLSVSFPTCNFSFFFNGHRILAWQVSCSFQSPKYVFYCLLASMIFLLKSEKHCWSQCSFIFSLQRWHFFLLAGLNIFFLSLLFKSLNLTDLVDVFFALGSLNSLNFWVDTFHQTWHVLMHCFFECCFWSYSSFQIFPMSLYMRPSAPSPVLPRRHPSS